MLYVVLLFLLAIWIHLSFAQETSKRYFLPLVLVMSPLAASGLLACSEQLLRWTESRRWHLNAGHGRGGCHCFCLSSSRSATCTQATTINVRSTPS